MPHIIAGLKAPVAHACIPLKFEGATKGVLNVAARPGEQFSEEELRFLDTLGHQIGLAVERARHRDAERRRNRQAQAMAVINRAIGSLDPEAILGAVGDTAKESWSVLTDYDNLSSFVSSMRSSSAARPESGRLLVTQEAVGRAGPFSRTLHVVLDVTEEPPDRIEFHDVCRASFQSYAGAWAIESDGAGARVTYALEARPRSSPPFFARSILASNARGLLEQVRLEMLRRGRIASAY
jgi:hypothetical protein